ncbi:MAG: LCP family protein [Candidatus Cryosericum sp.]
MMEGQEKGTGTRKRNGSTHRIIITIVLVILMLAVVFTGYEVWRLYSSTRPVSADPGTVVTPAPQPARLDSQINILILGCDARTKEDPGRSDSIMLAGLNPAAGTMAVMSIPRDTRVTIPGHGIGKINATTNKDVYSDGGIPLLEKTIEKLIPGIHVDYYVRTNFAGFAKVIDALGGVTIDVEERMYYKAVDTLIDLKPGVQHLDGAKALEYARFRADGVGDFGAWGGEEHGRVARQKKLLKAVIDQTKDLRNAWRLPKVIDVVQEAVVTDLPAGDMLRIGLAFKDATDQDVMAVVFPGIPKWEGGTSYVIPYTGPMAEKIAPLFKDAPVVTNPSSETPAG